MEITNDRRVRRYVADRKRHDEETNIQHVDITHKQKRVYQSDNQSDNTLQRVFQQRKHVMGTLILHVEIHMIKILRKFRTCCGVVYTACRHYIYQKRNTIQ